jgi:5'-nucleotidase/UDP-sugar diphosphatase
MAALKIIHTADLHGRLDERRAQALGFLKQQSGALLLDSGDAVSAPNIYVRRAGEPVLELMNRAGYDAMAVGNREYYFRKRGLLHKTARAQFPLLSANLLPRDGDLGHIRRWAVLETAGQRLGLFGLMPTMIKPGSWLEAFSDLRFVRWRSAAREAVEALRGQATWLVALSHLGLENDVRLAKICPELDLILGGHSHVTRPELVTEGAVPISHCGCYGRQAAVMDLEREAAGSTRIERRLVDLV